MPALPVMAGDCEDRPTSLNVYAITAGEGGYKQRNALSGGMRTGPGPCYRLRRLSGPRSCVRPALLRPARAPAMHRRPWDKRVHGPGAGRVTPEWSQLAPEKRGIPSPAEINGYTVVGAPVLDHSFKCALRTQQGKY